MVEILELSHPLYFGFTHWHSKAWVRRWAHNLTKDKERLSLQGIPSFDLPGLKNALTDPEVVSIDFHCDGKVCFTEQKELCDLFQTLMNQDRNWQAKLSCSRDRDGHGLKVLPLFKPVRCLELSRINEAMFPILKSFPNMEVLDLSCASMDSNFMHALYQDKVLASKTPHIMLLPTESTEEQDQPIQFPQMANKYLRSFAYRLEHGAPNKMSVPWIQEASRLKNLRYFHLSSSKLYSAMGDAFSQAYRGFEIFHVDGPICTPEILDALSHWISSPSCQLTHFYMDCCRYSMNSVSLEDFRHFLEAIGQNTSIEELCICDVGRKLDWFTDIVPFLLQSNVRHLVLRLGDWGTSEDLLMNWMIQQRHDNRLWSIRCSGEYEDKQRAKPLDCVSFCHRRWRKWQSPQSFHDEKKEQHTASNSAGTSVVKTLARCFWAQELNMIDFSGYEMFRPCTLDAMFFLLQNWLSSISDIPSVPQQPET